MTITKEEIAAMEAGPELDALVAERVMGDPIDWEHSWANEQKSSQRYGYPATEFHCTSCGQRWGYESDTPRCTAPAPRKYSRDISSAWIVLERVRATARSHAVLNDARRLVQVSPGGGIANTSWAFEIQAEDGRDDGYFCAFEIPGGINSVFAKGATGPLAICRAALLTTLPAPTVLP